MNAIAPITRAAGAVISPARSAAGTVVRTVQDWSRNAVDDWGRDPAFAARVGVASRVRWDVAVGGTQHIPARAGALVVVNARRWALAPVFAALALSEHTGRPVRFVGRPDIAPIGPLMQRLGALLPVESELEGALRDGEVVVLGAGHRDSNAAAGAVDHRLVGAAVAARVKVIPAATLSMPMRRAARVEVGAPVRPRRIRRGPLAELELADLAERRIDELLVELEGSLTGATLGMIAFDWAALRSIPGVLARTGVVAR